MAKRFRFKPRRNIDGKGGNTNGARAQWAEDALLVFRRNKYPDRDDHERPIKDLIADLLHLADREGLDGEHLLESGRGMWMDER